FVYFYNERALFHIFLYAILAMIFSIALMEEVFSCKTEYHWGANLCTFLKKYLDPSFYFAIVFVNAIMEKFSGSV
ncbi:hypothetical protein, partial [Bartonella sp. AA5SXTY]|uniref:hypothetical protein n=1 Tax=Bartonella sp. AA5SXTY TaxID=3243435 RepID=UPI0035CF202F